jgi:ABC-2 type transport system ATP-binding protein
MDEAQHLADRLMIIRSGEIVASGTAEELTRGLDHSSVITFRLPAGATPDDIRTVVETDVSTSGVLASLTSDRPQRELYRLTRWAEEQSVELGELTVQRPTLEDVFLELTSGEPPA